MSKKLAGKVAVVTGASKGIGAEIAEELAAEGAAVVVNYASSKAGAEAVVKRIAERDGRAIALQADLSKEADIRRMFAEAKKAFGRLDILVNNAGIYEFKPLEEITPEHFHKHFDLNVLAGGRQAFRPGRRQRYQHQLCGDDARSAKLVGLQRHEGGRRRDHESAGGGIGSPQDSR